MDPPEQDVELASLMEETIGDHGNGNVSGNGGGGPSSSYPSRSNNVSGRSRHQHSATATPSGNSSAKALGNNNNANDSSITITIGSSSCKALLLFILSSTVLLLVIMSSRYESAIETDAATTTSEAHHTNKGAVTSKSDQVNSNYAGFHTASPENMYGSNRYYKPPGVGYMPFAPRGGLHPIYLNEISAEERKSIEEGEDYYNGDYELSPYSDDRLKMTDAERKEEREAWKKKLQEIRDTYGYWNFEDDYPSKNKGKNRPYVDWDTIKSKNKDYDPILGELSKEDFPKDAWQTDNDYISKFVAEGKKLVKRVRTAIYDEHGFDSEATQFSMSLASPEGDKTLGGKGASIGWMNEDSFHAFAKKLLNAMVTNDHFFVTLGGHSAAAGHGNNFHQSYMMQFQEVMEPVFDRLGMVLVSANRAQGGMGTLQAALAGTGQYGEKDFVLWDSSMTEKGGNPQDVFIRQALLTGHRVPILFDMGGGKGMMDQIHTSAGGHVGGITAEGLTPKYKNTEFDFALKEHKYNAKCWTERADMEPPDVQYDTFGGQASWHPGNFVHQAAARKISLVFLHALEEALIVWENAMSTDGGTPLDSKYWHLQADEEKIRNALLTVKANETACGQILDFIPRACKTPMRGATEWSPKAYPDQNRLRMLVKPAPDGYVPVLLGVQEQAYKGRDPMIPTQRVPMGEVDVATIARSLPSKADGTKRALAQKRNRQYTRHHRPITNNAVSQYNKGVGHRQLENEPKKIVPGTGWYVNNPPNGPYCDGTSNAFCHGDKSNHCLMSGHNDARGVMVGDGLSGWIVFQLKDVTQGIVMARMEMYHQYKSNKRTEGWEDVNNGRVDDERRNERRRRELKAPPPPLLPSFTFEVAVNGVIQYSLNSTDYKTHCHYVSYNNDICVLWDNEEWAATNKKEDVEFAIWLGGEGSRDDMIAFTHLYYA